MKIYVIRHGQTTWNLSKRLQGRSDTELNEEGIQKAILTGQAFREVSFDMAFTSPLKRARQTAELFLQGRTVPIVEDERLIEISFGDYEGLSCREDHYEIPDPAFMNFFRNPDKYQVPPGGESLQSLGLRTRANKEEIICFLQDKNVPGDDIVYNELADEILTYLPEQGYLTISNALQWRLQYARVISLDNRVQGIVNYEW